MGEGSQHDRRREKRLLPAQPEDSDEQGIQGKIQVFAEVLSSRGILFGMFDGGVVYYHRGAFYLVCLMVAKCAKAYHLWLDGLGNVACSTFCAVRQLPGWHILVAMR